jgi:hypothetical protein
LRRAASEAGRLAPIAHAFKAAEFKTGDRGAKQAESIDRVLERKLGGQGVNARAIYASQNTEYYYDKLMTRR